MEPLESRKNDNFGKFSKFPGIPAGNFRDGRFPGFPGIPKREFPVALFGGGELGPHLTKCGQGRGLPACQVSC